MEEILDFYDLKTQQKDGMTDIYLVKQKSITLGVLSILYAISQIELLLDVGTIEKPIHEDITYDSIYDSQDNLWNFLFFTGY